jgi:nucleotide-binding universal stress UspA family protein
VTAAPEPGPVVFAYDGSDLAKLAIDEAGRQLAPGRDAIALTVWQPFNIGFIPSTGVDFDAAQVLEVKRAAERTAQEGASLAEDVGFRAKALAVEGAPSWKLIVDLADEHEAGLIVLGSHGRSGIADVLVGSVAAAVASHSRRSVLIAHRRS